MRRLIAAAAGSLLIAGSAFAEGAVRSEAKLATPGAATARASIADATWTCEGDSCVGVAAHRSLDNPVRECRKVVAVLGPVAAYTARGLKLDESDLKACNVVAAKSSASTAAK